MAAEVERLAVTSPATVKKPVSNRRLALQSRRGRTVQELAAAEGVSEGEIRLRLHLANEAVARPAANPAPSTAQATPVTPATRTRERRAATPVPAPASVAAADAPRKRARASARATEPIDGTVRE
jgi:hypothetical protein